MVISCGMEDKIIFKARLKICCVRTSNTDTEQRTFSSGGMKRGHSSKDFTLDCGATNKED